LGYYSIWPALACLALLLAAASVLPFGSVDIPAGRRQRISVLDGLRGFLALGVFFHHAAIYHRYILDGVWARPPSAVFVLFGQVGVALFFMITGYLFWSRTIAERGRPDWLSLYIGRVFRIGPLYLVAAGTMLAAVFVLTGFRISEPPARLSEHLLRWSLLGLFRSTEVNGFENPGRLLADVTWTLRYEWLFYFSLVATALAARSPKFHLPAIVVALTTGLAYLALGGAERHQLVAACICLFLDGMCCASLRAKGFTLRLPDWASSALVIAIGVLVFTSFSTAYLAAPVLLLGVIFYLIISDASVFGLLRTRAARRLGDVSYGIYLLQGLVLYFVFSFAPVRTFALASPLRHWAVICICALLLTAAAALAHHMIELPGIRFGKAATAWAGRLFQAKGTKKNSCSIHDGSTV
jgi:peptidoglycan/LPS O-acetylase OafA/YrhL